MPGSSALYCSGSFMVVTRLRAAVMASGDGVCADEPQTESKSTLAIINRRLDMGPSGDRSHDDTRYLSIPKQRVCHIRARLLARGQSSEGAPAVTVWSTP